MKPLAKTGVFRREEMILHELFGAVQCRYFNVCSISLFMLIGNLFILLLLMLQNGKCRNTNNAREFSKLLMQFFLLLFLQAGAGILTLIVGVFTIWCFISNEI